jgi:hypothetical protein
MNPPDEPAPGGLTRAQMLGAAIGGGAAVAGVAVAAPSASTDVEILNLFLLLEQVQERFYGEALRAARLQGDLRTYAGTVGAQETQHVALLSKRLGGRARPRPQSDFGDAVTDPERFQAAAIKLEESTIAAYIAQGANLTRDALAAIVPLVSVEARQAAWVRDLAGVSPAPRVADLARDRDDVLNELRGEGFI